MGSRAFRWRTVHAVTVVTGDLELASEAAHWTMRERPWGIEALNRRSEKRYRLLMEELKEC